MDVRKTGMGSSAAMITSLTASLLQFFGVVDLRRDIGGKEEENLSIIHNLAQIVHAAAQGKIGSGFDVASAVYGSIIYQRFRPEPLQFVMEDDVTGDELLSAVTDTGLWLELTAQRIQLPAPMDLMMGDISGGSSSTSMVSPEVGEWKRG